ncbi:hypothetical protein EV714DRAFT_269713 [Schizophyllum commune]
MAGDKPKRARKQVNLSKRMLESDSEDDRHTSKKKKPTGQGRKDPKAAGGAASSGSAPSSSTPQSVLPGGPVPPQPTQRGPIIEIIDEPEPRQRSPKNPNVILEEDDGSDDSDEVEELDTEPVSGVSKSTHEDNIAKLERLQRSWTGFIYAFYKPHVDLDYVAGKGGVQRLVHVFSSPSFECFGLFPRALQDSWRDFAPEDFKTSGRASFGVSRHRGGVAAVADARSRPSLGASPRLLLLAHHPPPPPPPPPPPLPR